MSERPLSRYLTRKQMAVRQEPPWNDDLDLSWKERGKIVLGGLIGFLGVMAVLVAIFIAGASPTP